MVTFSAAVSEVLGCSPSADVLAKIFALFVVAGVYLITVLIKGVVHK